MFFEVLHLRDCHYILPTAQEDQPGVALLHISSNDINNQTKDEINTEKLTEDDER